MDRSDGESRSFVTLATNIKELDKLLVGDDEVVGIQFYRGQGLFGVIVGAAGSGNRRGMENLSILPEIRSDRHGVHSSRLQQILQRFR